MTDQYEEWRLVLGLVTAKAQERFDRLPKYAQREVKTLACDLVKARRYLADITGKLGGEGHHMLKVQVGADGTPLPDTAVIRFSLGTWSDEWIEFRVDQDAVGSFITVYAGSQIDIEPRAANHVYLRVLGVGTRRDHA